MIQTITLNKYLELGGVLEKVSPSIAYLNQYNEGKKIKDIKFSRYNSSGYTPIYLVTFEDNTTTELAGLWISVQVYLTLERKYLPIKLEDKAFEMLNLLERIMKLQGLIKYSNSVAIDNLVEYHAINDILLEIQNFVKSVK